jgi:uncharacterized membrane protein YdjX (TVP38/TMEM64 family)
VTHAGTGPSRRVILWRRAATLLLVTAVLAVVASLESLHHVLLDLVHVVDRLIVAHPYLGALAFVGFAAASAMLAFVSSALLVPPALVAWGQLVTFLLLWLGWILGGVAAYTLTRFLGRPVVDRLVAAETRERYANLLSGRMSFGLVLLFQTALPSEIPGYVLGFARYPIAKYLAALSLAELPYAVGTVFLGASLLARRTVPLVALGLLGALLSLTALRALHRRPRPSPGGAGAP